ncbi:MAG: hypothetical protein U9R60_16335 [Bacteroidota bacterium]|nr:hypothetical protein [Bacteroidota bacterium]
MDITVDLCPKVYSGASIKRSHGSMPSVSGYTISIMPLGGSIEVGDYWKVPIQGDCDIYDAFPVQAIRWAQRYDNQITLIPPYSKKVPRNQWDFKFTLPEGWFDLCPQCFDRRTNVKLLGVLGFNGGESFPDKNGEVSWEVYRENLPFPGERLVALTVVPGEGDVRIYRGPCTPAGVCSVGGDCVWVRRFEMRTTGKFLQVGEGFFATPTWTGGEVLGYQTAKTGPVLTPEDSQLCPTLDVYGDPTLQYIVEIEGESETLSPTDFAGYGTGLREGIALGSFVLTRKMDQVYEEPYNDSVLGSGGNKVIFPWHINSVGP